MILLACIILTGIYQYRENVIYFTIAGIGVFLTSVTICSFVPFINHRIYGNTIQVAHFSEPVIVVSENIQKTELEYNDYYDNNV